MTTQAGIKHDIGKAMVRKGLLEQFPRACMEVAKVSKFGADVYTWDGWHKVENNLQRYGDAEVRHICMAAIEGPIDSESGLLHAAHEAWNALCRLEIMLEQGEDAK